MADFQRSIADQMGVSLRAVRRWCERGQIPGTYATKGGHWRIRRPSKSKLVALRSKARGRGFKRLQSFEWRLADAIMITTRTKAEHARWKRITAPMLAVAQKATLMLNPELKARALRVAEWANSEEGAIWQRALELSIEMRYAHERITPEERESGGWRATAPEFWDLLHNEVDHSCMILPLARAAAEKEAESTRLFTAAQSIANEGGRMSASALARKMQMPRATFYRHFTRKQVSKAKAIPFAGASLAERRRELSAKKNGRVIAGSV